MCDRDRDSIGVSSVFKVIRSSAVIERIFPTRVLSCEDTVERRKWKSPLVECTI